MTTLTEQDLAEGERLVEIAFSNPVTGPPLELRESARHGLRQWLWQSVDNLLATAREALTLRAEVERLTRERNQWQAECDKEQAEAIRESDRADRAEAALAEARKDAERYRWLVTERCEHGSDDPIYLCVQGLWLSVEDTKAQVDAAIDSARGEKPNANLA